MEKKIDSYLKTYSSQKVKYFIVTFFSLSFLCIGIPLICILAMKDAYPDLQSLPWINYIQQALLGSELIFFLLIFSSYILKERKKIASLILFDFTQWMVLILLSSGMYFAIVIFIKDPFSKILLILPYVLGILKVIWDMRRKNSRLQQAEILTSMIEKVGPVVFFALIVLRWISAFIFPEKGDFSIIAILSPLLIVVALVFCTEYQWERILLLKKAYKNQEKYRIENGMSIRDWYGSNSKEYKENDYSDDI